MLRFTAADELVRLVREASEIEHALLVRYLYASFSVKSRCQAVIRTGATTASASWALPCRRCTTWPG
jgi:hypothetical protein